MSVPGAGRSYGFHPGASQEFVEASDRIRQDNPAAADAFEDSVDDAIELLLRHPQAGRQIVSSRGRSIRAKVLTGRFRFTLIYADLPKKVYILAVAHQRRRPGYWRSRLRSM